MGHANSCCLCSLTDEQRSQGNTGIEQPEHVAHDSSTKTSTPLKSRDLLTVSLGGASVNSFTLQSPGLLAVTSAITTTSSLPPDSPCFPMTPTRSHMLFKHESIGSHSPSVATHDDALRAGKDIDIQDLQEMLRTETKDSLKEESANEECEIKQFDDDMKLMEIECPSIRRIERILRIYHKFIHESSLWTAISAQSLLHTKREQYGHQQLVDDFIHIQCVHSKHIPDLYALFERELECSSDCISNRRHLKERNVENESALYHTESVSDECRSQRRMDIINEKDMVFQQELDKIQFGVHCDYVTTP